MLLDKRINQNKTQGALKHFEMYCWSEAKTTKDNIKRLYKSEHKTIGYLVHHGISYRLRSKLEKERGTAKM